MVTVSQALADAIAAGNPQRVLLEFYDSNGTLTRTFSNEDVSVSRGVTLRETFNGDTDLAIGQCPSAEISFTLLNDVNQITSFEFGKFKAWLGARIDEEGSEEGVPIVPTTSGYIRLEDPANDTSVAMTNGSPTITASSETSALKLRYTLIEVVEGERYHINCTSVAAKGPGMLLIKADGTILDRQVGTAESARQNRTITIPSNAKWLYLVRNLGTSGSARGTNNTFSKLADVKRKTFTEGGVDRIYEFAPLGTFIADRPDVVRKKMIDITANDQMVLFDKEWSSSGISVTWNGLTAGNLLTAICQATGITCATSTFLNSTVALTGKPSGIDNMTVREVLGWIAEAAASVARFNRDGELELVWFAPVARTFDEHGYTEFTPAWYEVSQIDKLAVRNANQTSEVVVGTGTTSTYVITNNPFLRS